MKKVITSLVRRFTVATLVARSTTVTLMAFKEIDNSSGYWTNWPCRWSFFADVGLAHPQIRVTHLSEDSRGEAYHLEHFVDGNLDKEMFIKYDEIATSEIRKLFGDQWHCYVDEEGDRVFTEHFSLKELSWGGGEAWNENPKAKMLLRLNSEGKASQFI